jgi:hypothetical protein
MRAQNYGRILMTTSASGLFGNFGQTNYGAAKMALVGLMHMLNVEGRKNNIRVNTIAPFAATRMTEDIMSPEAFQRSLPEQVTPAALFLVSDDAPSKMILSAGAGCFSTARLVDSAPVYLAADDLTPENIARHFSNFSDWGSARAYEESKDQVKAFRDLAAQKAPA